MKCQCRHDVFSHLPLECNKSPKWICYDLTIYMYRILGAKIRIIFLCDDCASFEFVKVRKLD